MELPPYVVLEKAVGETPLACMETWRKLSGVAADIPLTYAGRLDPMASGKLLVLVGEECKKKDRYLALDKTYEFSVLLGIGSDTHDVLGRLQTDPFLQSRTPFEAALGAARPRFTTPERVLDLETQLRGICQNLTGEVELPYPHFSSKTVQGKPLHMWTLEGRLTEIDIPTKKSTIYSLKLNGMETCARSDLAQVALEKINTIPEVTDTSKTLGNDFRREDVRKDWDNIKNNNLPTSDVGKLLLPDAYTIAHFTCSASSGTYMRTLAKLIGERLDPAVPSLAWSIHRTEIRGIG